MTHSSLSFATVKVTNEGPSLTPGIGTGVLLVTIAREGSKQDGAADVEGTPDTDGLKDGLVEGSVEGAAEVEGCELVDGISEGLKEGTAEVEGASEGLKDGSADSDGWDVGQLLGGEEGSAETVGTKLGCK